MIYDCKLNGRLSSNVDGHVDNYVLMLCSMLLTILVRLVFNIKKTCYEQHVYKYIIQFTLLLIAP